MPSLGNDLALIRKDLKLSIEDIHQSTKIPVAILESIEDDSIFVTLDENQTYIRSYIRTYARVLKIGEDQIVRALDQVESGGYTGFLRSSEAAEPASKDEQDTRVTKTKHGSEESGSANSQNTETEDKAFEPAQGGQITPPPTVKSVDWADMGRKFTPLQTKSRMWMTTGLLVLGVLAVALYVVYHNYYAEVSAEPEVTSAPSNLQELTTPDPDSLQLEFTTPAIEDSVANSPASETTLEALPDTLTLVIYAAYGVLEPVRVFTDVMDGLNPYWIEQGEAFQFDFVNSIRIRGQYSRMVLMMNGHMIENFRERFLNPESGMVEINRDVFENDPKWLQAPPDSLQINAPAPTIIKERPTFN